MSDERDALARAMTPPDSIIWDDPENWWVAMRESALDAAARVLASNWLTEHDRAVAEKTWQEGWDQGFRDYQARKFEDDGYEVVTPTPNPHLPQSTNSQEAP